MNAGQTLCVLREGTGQSRSEVAARARVSDRRLARIESGGPVSKGDQWLIVCALVEVLPSVRASASRWAR